MDVTISTTTPIPAALLDLADSDRYLGGYVEPKTKKPRVAILYRGEVVGFFTPRERAGYHRTGAIFILPQYRGKGVGKAAIKLFFADKRGEALIDDDNHASIRAFQYAGFQQDAAFDDTAHWYVKELRFLEKLSL